MSTLSSIAIACLILLTWNQMADGLACYSCANCNDPFNQNYISILYYNDTIPYYCSKTSVSFTTSRSIVPTCSPYGTAGNGQWCCQTNLCNGAKKNILTNPFSFGISVLIFTIFFRE